MKQKTKQNHFVFSVVMINIFFILSCISVNNGKAAMPVACPFVILLNQQDNTRYVLLQRIENMVKESLSLDP